MRDEQALTVQDRGEVAVPENNVDAFLVMLERAARDPQVDVDKLDRLLQMKERAMAKTAETEFSIAMSAAQDEMRPVVRDAENSQTRSKYARLETIDRAVRPIYTKHGFSLSFNSGTPRKEGAVRILCRVRHVAGHFEDYELEGDLDVSGAKGSSNKTGIQGLGSSASYLRKYLTLLIFNLQMTNEDNDGQGALTEQQKMDIIGLAAACEMTPDERQRFINLIGTDKLESLAPHRYDDVAEILRKKIRMKEKQGGAR